MDRLFPPASRSRLALPAILRPVLRTVVLVLLWGGLWGCGWANPAPPRSVVAEAVAQKVAQTQVVLQRQLGMGADTDTDTEAIPLPQASGIRVTGHHWLTRQNPPTLEVNGTYHLKGGGLSWGQQRQTRPFSLYLRRAGEDQWVVVDPPMS